MSLFLLAAIGLTSTVLAATPVATAEQQAEMSAEGSQLARLQALEAELAAAQAKLDGGAKCPADCPVAPKPVRTSVPKPTVTPVVSVAPALVPDPQIAEQEALIVVLEAEIATLKAAIDRPIVVNVAAPVVNVEAPKVTVAPVVHTEHTTVVRTSGFGLIGYAGVDVAITKSYFPVYGTASGRLVGGVRPAWDVGSGAAKFGLDIEGNWTPQVGVGSGFGLRAVPTLIGSFDGLDLGLGFGPAYDCSVLVAEGCLAEHIGGLARGTLLIGNGAGVRLHADVEVNYLTVSSDPEIRTVIGVDLFVGRRHDTYGQ